MTAAVPLPLSISRLLHIFDPSTRLRFLIETGAGVSIVPPTNSDRTRPSSTTLKAANGTPIATYGQRFIQLNLNLRRSFNWLFTIADVSSPIIGAVFLSNFSLMVDGRSKCLVDSTTSLRTVGTLSNSVFYGISFLSPQLSEPFGGMLANFPSLTQPL